MLGVQADGTPALPSPVACIPSPPSRGWTNHSTRNGLPRSATMKVPHHFSRPPPGLRLSFTRDHEDVAVKPNMATAPSVHRHLLNSPPQGRVGDEDLDGAQAYLLERGFDSLLAPLVLVPSGFRWRTYFQASAGMDDNILLAQAMVPGAPAMGARTRSCI